METYFEEIARVAQSALAPGERFTATLDAEETDFVRMNRGKVRQPGSVRQCYLSLRLIAGTRHAEHTLSLKGDPGDDAQAVRDALASLRSAMPELADDPLLLLPSEVRNTRSVRAGTLAPAEAVVEDILREADGCDLVGIYAGGPIYRGFANSEGQRNWHETTAFNFQWSLYHRADKAVKTGYAGFAWNEGEFAHKMREARERLALIGRPSRALPPGQYRAYLAPAAMEEIASVLCWGGFSGRALATRQSGLAKMREGASLDPRVSFVEDTAQGVAPSFQAEGFPRPDRVPLVESGRLVGSLVSPRTAREFGLTENGANGYEMPESLSMGGGTLRCADALEALGTGLAIGNLHYLNYSDRPACRITGMTRFATFWVEDGKVVAPVDVLRFDDTLYRLLGENLEHLTRETEFILDAGTYQARQLASLRVPGALVKEMAFTL
ncbi:MAG: metallopeptidase TldD-related protein [Burkholderiales bacterium]